MVFLMSKRFTYKISANDSISETFSCCECLLSGHVSIPGVRTNDPADLYTITSYALAHMVKMWSQSFFILQYIRITSFFLHELKNVSWLFEGVFFLFIFLWDSRVIKCYLKWLFFFIFDFDDKKIYLENNEK